MRLKLEACLEPSSVSKMEPFSKIVVDLVQSTPLKILYHFFVASFRDFYF